MTGRDGSPFFFSTSRTGGGIDVGSSGAFYGSMSVLHSHIISLFLSTETFGSHSKIPS